VAVSNLASFNAGVLAFAQGNERTFRTIRNKVGLQGLAGLTLKTPVLTGRARANWQVSEGDPAQGDVENVDPTGGETISDGNGKIARAATYGVLYITNNLPYIERLENGWSRQAPGGMLELTFQELQSQFR
jgi:hypothetical protein